MTLQLIVRIAGRDCRGDRLVPYAINKIKGVGIRYAHIVCRAADIPPNVRLGELTEEEIMRLEDAILNPQKYSIPPYLYNRQKDPETGEHKHVVENDLIIAHKYDIDLLKKTRSYRGIRHALGLKVRGQRTKSTGRKGTALGVKRKKR